MNVTVVVILIAVCIIFAQYMYNRFMVKEHLQNKIDALEADREALKISVTQNLQSADEIEKVRQDSYEKLTKTKSGGLRSIAKFMRTGK